MSLSEIELAQMTDAIDCELRPIVGDTLRLMITNSDINQFAINIMVRWRQFGEIYGFVKTVSLDMLRQVQFDFILNLIREEIERAHGRNEYEKG